MLRSGLILAIGVLVVSGITVFSIAFAEAQLELDLKSVVFRESNELFFTLEGQGEPNFKGRWFLVSADGNKIHSNSFTAYENGYILDKPMNAGFTKQWIKENPTARLEVYRAEDVNPASSYHINVQDRSKAILIKKVDLNVYFSKQITRDVLVSDNSFSPNKITINLGDSIKFHQNDFDFPQLQIEFAPPPRPNTVSGLNGVGIGNNFQFWVTGDWVISDIFNPNTKLNVSVIIPDEQERDVSEIESPKIEEPKQKLPDWVRNVFIWYGDGIVSEDEIINAIRFLIKEGIIKV